MSGGDSITRCVYDVIFYCTSVLISVDRGVNYVININCDICLLLGKSCVDSVTYLLNDD